MPLPTPYPIPLHFRSDVEVALNTKKMTKETKSAFFSAVAASMLAYKRYPSADDYRNVAQSVCERYSFFKSPIGEPYVRTFN